MRTARASCRRSRPASTRPQWASARRDQVSLVTVGIPALALGLLVAIPTVVVSGPLFGRLAGRWVDVPAPHTFDAERTDDSGRPSFAVTLASVLLLAWVLAVLIRLATGSATIATITASSLMIGLVEGLSSSETSLVVLAIGAGSSS